MNVRLSGVEARSDYTKYFDFAQSDKTYSKNAVKSITAFFYSVKSEK